MASLVLRLDPRTSRNGMQNIRIRISHRNTSAFVNTGVSVEPQHFTGNLYDPIDRRTKLAENKRESIATMVRKIEAYIYDMQRDNPGALSRMCAKDIKEHALCVRESIQDEPKNNDFIEFFISYGKERKSVNTQEHYASYARMLQAFCSSTRRKEILFEDIDYNLLCELKRWVRNNKHGEHSRFCLESYMRAVYREAERQHIIGRDKDPFFDYRIEQVPEKDIEDMSVEQLRKVIFADLSKYEEGVNRARDMLVLSFYLCGANLIDIYSMEKPEDNTISFVRHKIQEKTHRKVYIHVEPEMQKIIDRYAGETHLLRFAECTNMFDTFQRNLKRPIYKLQSILGVKVDFAILRRTWSTIAGELEVPDRVIDKSVGHKDKSVKDIHYEKYDWNRTRKHNRRVMDYVLYNKRDDL